jgi:hypothetical protein
LASADVIVARVRKDVIIARVRKMVAHPITVFISASSVNSTGGELAPPRIVPTVQVAL